MPESLILKDNYLANVCMLISDNKVSVTMIRSRSNI